LSFASSFISVHKTTPEIVYSHLHINPTFSTYAKRGKHTSGGSSEDCKDKKTSISDHTIKESNEEGKAREKFSQSWKIIRVESLLESEKEKISL
jgi:hypothetical protein